MAAVFDGSNIRTAGGLRGRRGRPMSEITSHICVEAVLLIVFRDAPLLTAG